MSIQDTTLLLLVGSQLQLTWNPRDVVPFADPSSYTVDVTLYEPTPTGFNLLAVLATDIPNDGVAGFIIPAVKQSFPISPVNFQVAFKRSLNPSDNSILDPVNIANVSMLGIWSAVGYLTSTLEKLQPLCDDWVARQPPGIGEQLLSRLIPCPPTEAQARLPNSGLIDDADPPFISEFFHPGASACFRSIRADA